MAQYETCEKLLSILLMFFSSRRRHTRLTCDWSSDVCSSDVPGLPNKKPRLKPPGLPWTTFSLPHNPSFCYNFPMLMIKLAPTGKKHQRHYRLVVAEKRVKLTGNHQAILGHYHPLLPKSDPSRLVIDRTRIEQWLKKGAQ